ncbi:hypothetical protein RRG08_059498 [Elysia crispata]|uniref:Uncharacterized protein n=1 Tax=Elysia crispata TaxID=231223 RepID=A0AAE1A0X4_9GAST|nr:hypothetical protein RRG08_059498 [Elysia crispata]
MCSSSSDSFKIQVSLTTERGQPVTEDKQQRENSPKIYTDLLPAAIRSSDHPFVIDGDPNSQNNRSFPEDIVEDLRALIDSFSDPG